MKLCAAVPGETDQKIAILQRLGLWGTGLGLDLDWTVEEARDAVAPYRAAGLHVVQVGCYRNLIAVDEAVRAAAIRDVRRALELAGAVGVPNVICGGGHRHPTDRSDNAGVHSENWTDRALDILVESCQEIVSHASPSAATLCLEPWVITSLSSPSRLEQVVRRVNHPKLAIELDPVNLMTIERYADTGRFLTECFERLGETIRLVHAKDSLLKPRPYSYHMSEAVPGDGNLDYLTLLRLMQRLPNETPLLVEHLPDEETIGRACTYIRGVARQLSLTL